ncbi:aliphatic sulfonate ABC transporter substrate-binding protein [Vulcanococcus limneticus]|uniref:aliphatic sulfonate ABC transporter substrate-binding protein n=1 Tax=Vulcanococcus limneticus TaxID=2170428 RepID=UPI00398C008D
MFRLALATGLALAGTLGLSSSSSALAQAKPASTVRLDYAYYNPVSLVLKDRGILEKELKKKNIKVEWVLSQGSNKALEFLGARSLDFGSTAGAAAFIGKANGNPIKAIYVYSKPEWASLVVPNGSKIKSVKDLKGKKVAANRGTDPYIFLLRTLDRNGLAPRDVEIVQLAHADGKTALEKGDVDAWAGLDPLTAKSEIEAKSKLLYRNPDFNTFGVLNVREEFAKQNPDTVLSVLRAYEQARQWALKNPQELKKVLITDSKLTDAVATRQLERTDLRNSSIGAPQKTSILAAADVLKKAGVIPPSTNTKAVVDSLIDPSYVNKLKTGK